MVCTCLKNKFQQSQCSWSFGCSRVHRGCTQQPLWKLQMDSSLWLCCLTNTVLRNGKKILRLLEVMFPLFYFSKKYLSSDPEIKTMFCSSSNQFLGSAVAPISVLQEALTLDLLRTLGKMSTLPLFHNLSMHSTVLCILKELKNGLLNLKKNINAFLLFSCWSNNPVQSTLNCDGAQSQNNAFLTQINSCLFIYRECMHL